MSHIYICPLNSLRVQEKLNCTFSENLREIQNYDKSVSNGGIIVLQHVSNGGLRFFLFII